MPPITLTIAPPPAQAKAVDVVCLGESSLDFVAVVDSFPAPDAKVIASTFQAMPGGQAATAAVTCARQGWRTRYVGCLGADAWGDTISSSLTWEGVALSVIRRPEARSRTAVIIVESASGRRTIVEHRDTRQRIGRDEVDPAVLTSGRVLLVDATDPEASTVAAAAARAAGIPTVVDADRQGPDVDALFAEIDVLMVSASFASSSEGPAGTLRKLTARFRPALAVMTLGAEGSLALAGGRELRTPAPDVPVVDTTGAGDAFRGGFASAWLRFGPEADVRVLLQHANATAALNCGAMGAQGGLPKRELVDALVTRAYGGQSK